MGAWFEAEVKYGGVVTVESVAEVRRELLATMVEAAAACCGSDELAEVDRCAIGVLLDAAGKWTGDLVPLRAVVHAAWTDHFARHGVPEPATAPSRKRERVEHVPAPDTHDDSFIVHESDPQHDEAVEVSSPSALSDEELVRRHQALLAELAAIGAEMGKRARKS